MYSSSDGGLPISQRPHRILFNYKSIQESNLVLVVGMNFDLNCIHFFFSSQTLAVLFSCLTLTYGFNLNLGHLSKGQLTGPAPNGRVQMSRSQKVDANLCPLCIQFTGQAINQLLNIILSE